MSVINFQKNFIHTGLRTILEVCSFARLSGSSLATIDAIVGLLVANHVDTAWPKYRVFCHCAICVVHAILTS